MSCLRHWFTYYGWVGSSAPTCMRCGAPNPGYDASRDPKAGSTSMELVSDVRGLTLIQPWASLITFGAKRVETRSWSTAYRGPILIHAGRSMPVGPGARLPLGEWEVERDQAGLLLRGPIEWPYRLPLGAVVAVADIIGCDLTEGLTPDPYGNYGEGRYGWALGGVQRLRTPIPVKGALGLWRPSPDLLAHVRKQMPGWAE